MIIRLDWLQCTPRKSWENQIHLMLEDMSALRQITHAAVCVKDNPDKGQRFHLSTELGLSGPDVREETRGQTFAEALLKMQTQVSRRLLQRQSDQRKRDGAPRGVKPQHRG
jgi:hypothetical protein